MSRDFYRAFEDRFRGSREAIKSRLRVYLAFVEPLAASRHDFRALDVGCGRGEWLELMRDIGIHTMGVDRDEGMLAACRDAGLEVKAEEAGSWLSAAPPQSWDLITGFHVAEHLGFDGLQELVRQSHRTLRPGGLLILETPNPENVFVGSNSFYLDPTHGRPLPPGLLAFLAEHYAFNRVKIMRLQELTGLAENPAPTLLNVLRDASPDYAVVAQKEGEGSVAALDAAFEREYGVSAEMLAARYDAAAEARIARAEAHAREAAVRTRELLDSKSWRWTAPLRWLADAVQRLTGSSKN